MVSTRPARRASRPAQPTSLLPSWLSQHVSASEQLSRNHYWRPRTRPDPSTRTPTTWFRHDQLLRRRSAQPASLLPSWLSQHVSASEQLSRNHLLRKPGTPSPCGASGSVRSRQLLPTWGSPGPKPLDNRGECVRVVGVAAKGVDASPEALPVTWVRGCAIRSRYRLPSSGWPVR